MINLDIKKKFYGKNCVLEDVSIELSKSNMYFLLGHNGAGKSTLIKTMLGIIGKTKRDIYTVRVDGEEMTEKNRKNFRGYFTYAPENSDLIDELKVFEYLSYTFELYNGIRDTSTIEEYMKIFDLTKYRDKYIAYLSHGNKRKVVVCSAMMNPSEIVVLDEPFSGLDPVSIRDLKKILLSLRNRIILISTHQLDIVDSMLKVAKNFRFIILNEGRQVFEGHSSKLFEDTNAETIEESYLKLVEKFYD